MSVLNACPYCNAALDPEEKCDCDGGFELERRKTAAAITSVPQKKKQKTKTRYFKRPEKWEPATPYKTFGEYGD